MLCAHCTLHISFIYQIISRPVSRVMSWMVIYLELLLPTASSDLPESKPGRLIAFVLVLLRMGFTCAPVVTNRAVVSYTALPPLLLRMRNSGIFLLHWPWSRLHRTLSGILPYEARTFLTPQMRAAIICSTYSYQINYSSTKESTIQTTSRL